MTYQCTRSIKTHNNKQYKLGQEITILEYNTLSFSERESFIRVDNKEKVSVGMEGDHSNEL